MKERAGTLNGRRSAIARTLLAAIVLAGCSSAPPAERTPSPGSSATTPTVASSPSPTPPAIAISKDRAVAIAREAVPRRAAASVLQADLGPYGDLGYPEAPVRVSPAPTSDHLAWRINLGTVRGPLDAAGTYVVIDAADGTVLQAVDWIS